MYKELIGFNTKRKPDLKMDRGPKQTFFQKDIQMANRHMKICSASLMIREMQIETTMRYHLTPVRLAIIKKTTDNKRWWGCEERAPCTAGGVQTGPATVEGSMDAPQKAKSSTPMWPGSHSWGKVRVRVARHVRLYVPHRLQHASIYFWKKQKQ